MKRKYILTIQIMYTFQNIFLSLKGRTVGVKWDSPDSTKFHHAGYVTEMKKASDARNQIELQSYIDRIARENNDEKKAMLASIDAAVGNSSWDEKTKYEAFKQQYLEALQKAEQAYVMEKAGVWKAAKRDLKDEKLGINTIKRGDDKFQFFTEKENREAAKSLKLVFPDFKGELADTNLVSLLAVLPTLAWSNELISLLESRFTNPTDNNSNYSLIKDILVKAKYTPDGLFDHTELTQIQELLKYYNWTTPENKQKVSTISSYISTGKDIEYARKEMEVSSKITKENVFTFLSDRDASGIVSVWEGDEHILPEATILDELKKASSTSKEFYSQIRNLLLAWGATPDFLWISSVDTLVSALQKNPLLKEAFLRGADKVGAGFSSFLRGEKAFQKYIESRRENYQEIQKIVENEVSASKVTSGLEKKITETTDPKAKWQYKAMLDNFKSNEWSILSQLRYEGTSLLLGNVDGKWLVWLGGTVDAGWLLNIDFGLTTIAGKVVPGIGIHKTLGGRMSESTRGNVTVGVMNVIPYIAAGVDVSTFGKINTTDALDNKAKSYGLTVNLSTVWWGLTGTYRESASETIGENEAALRKVLAQLVTATKLEDIDKADLNKGLPEGKKLSNTDITLIKATLKNTLVAFGFKDDGDVKNTASILWRVLESYIITLRESQIQKASKDGYTFSGASLGVQFVAGFFPIPVIGASWEKISAKYAGDGKESAIDTLRRLDPKSAIEISQEEFLGLLRHELGDKTAVLTRLPDGSISFKKPAHLNIFWATDLASEKDSVVTIKSWTRIRSWDRTGSKDAEFSIFLEKAPLKFDLSQITKELKDTGITVVFTGDNLQFSQWNKHTSLPPYGYEVLIEKKLDKSTVLTSKPSLDPKAPTSVKVSTETAGTKLEIIKPADLKWMSDITNEIYDTKTQKKMFELRRIDGPVFRAYRMAVADMMQNPADKNKLAQAQKALLELIAAAPKALAPLTSILNKASSDKELAFILAKTYDLTLGSLASHAIGELANDEKTLTKAGKKYDTYAEDLAKDFAKVWSERGIAISEDQMKSLMKREEGESLIPSTISKVVKDAHGVVGFNTLAQLNSQGKSAMNGLAPFMGDAPILGKVWGLKEFSDIAKAIINKVVDSMTGLSLPKDIPEKDYRDMLKWDTTARTRIEKAGYTVIGETQAWIARSGVPGAVCTNPLPFITQPRLEKKWVPVTVDAKLSSEGISFAGSSSNEVNRVGMEVSNRNLWLMAARSLQEKGPPTTETRIDTRDVQVSPKDIKIITEGGQNIVQITSGWTQYNIPLAQLTRTQYIDFLGGKTITIPLNVVSSVTVNGKLVPIGDLSKIKNLSLTLLVGQISFEELADTLAWKLDDFDKAVASTPKK